MRIRHVIPTVGSSAPAQLRETQDLTLRSVERALRCTGPGLEVEVRAVHFADEPVDQPWLVDMPILERSILDLGEFEVARRLPLLPDVLAGFGDPSEYDVAVLTNADIAVQPLFYDLVESLTGDGYDACSITRRTVYPRFGATSLARLAATGGAVHPGHDCFVMSAALVERMDPGDAALGVRFVARTLLWQLLLLAVRFRAFGDLHATFHIGDDRVWVDPRLADYERHNQRVAVALIERLVADHGRDRVERLHGVGPFLRAIDDGSAVETPRPRSTVLSIDSRPPSGGAQRLVFSANPGRSGSNYLAELLGAAPRTVAGHERQPTMTGPWLRRTLYDDPAESYAERMVKVDAIRSELEQMPHDWTYIDTSHMFVKTFADVVFDDFQHENISVVVLRRDPIEVAKSFFELDFFGPRSGAWMDWMSQPTAPFAAFRLELDEIHDQFDLIFASLVDHEVRTETLREASPGVHWIYAPLEVITTVEGAADLLRQLRLAAPADLAPLVESRVNTRGPRKSNLDQPVSTAYVRERADDFLARQGHCAEVAGFFDRYRLESVA